MLDRLNSVSVAASLPQFVTMTLPDESFCDDVGEFAKRAKHWLDVWERRLLRVAPKACGFWRIEWKARQSGQHEGKLFPHFHLLVWGLPERSLGCRVVDGVEVEVSEGYVECPDTQLSFELVELWSAASKQKGEGEWRWKSESATTGHVFAGSRRFVERARTVDLLCIMSGMEGLSDGQREWADRARKMSFQDWASLAWYYVVDSHNLAHVQAGVRVERVRTWGGVMSYASKYLSKADAEFMSDIQWGRSWGVFNRACVPWARMLELELDNDVGVRLRRVARRYLERRSGRRVRAPYGITLYCDVARFRRLWEEHSPPDPF
jgi:hypothetical protein